MLSRKLKNMLNNKSAKGNKWKKKNNKIMEKNNNKKMKKS